jgi:REP element-mobilizing transposase RayT
VWAYCLMPNYVHMILKPTRADDLGRAVGETRRRYTNFINARGRWTGHLFQGPSPTRGEGARGSVIIRLGSVRALQTRNN